MAICQLVFGERRHPGSSLPEAALPLPVVSPELLDVGEEEGV